MAAGDRRIYGKTGAGQTLAATPTLTLVTVDLPEDGLFLLGFDVVGQNLTASNNVYSSQGTAVLNASGSSSTLLGSASSTSVLQVTGSGAQVIGAMVSTAGRTVRLHVSGSSVQAWQWAGSVTGLGVMTGSGAFGNFT